MSKGSAEFSPFRAPQLILTVDLREEYGQLWFKHLLFHR